MAKHKTPHRKTILKSAPQITEAIEINRGWKNMTNWLIGLVLILPVLYSNKTIDPNISIRYIFLSLFIFLFYSHSLCTS